MITYMTEVVSEKDLMREHNLTWMEVYKLRSNNVGGSFILDELEYKVPAYDPTIKHTKRSYYTISKGDVKYTRLAPKEVTFYTGKAGSTISGKTIKTGSAMLNGWLVEREGFVLEENKC